MKPSIPEGVRDFGPEQVAKRNYIFDTIRTVFVRYGYQPIETPTFEKLSTLLKNKVIFDGRNIYDPTRMRELGFTYVGVGRR